jgi:hypothetical protein
MRRIPVQLGQPREMTLVEFLRAGDSWSICVEAHRWPPLATFNAFLQCGFDDADGETMEWPPFQVEPNKYSDARLDRDPAGIVDPLGVADGDWAGWFEAAVAMLRPN